MLKTMNVTKLLGGILFVYVALHAAAVGESIMRWSKIAKYPDYLYACVMPSEDTAGMRTMLQAFSITHAMSFQWGPLNPEGSEVAIELIGHGARVFAVNIDTVREFFLDIRPYGHEAGYEAFAAKLSDALVAELKKLPGVMTEWERLPVGYQTDLPASTRAARGPPPP